MSAVLQLVDPLAVVARAHAAYDELQTLDPTGYDDDTLLAYWREHERLRRRMATGEHRLIHEAEARDARAAPGAFDAQFPA